MVEVLVRSVDSNKNTHISFKITNEGHVLVVENNEISNTNPANNNPAYYMYDSIEDYLEDFNDSYFNDTSMIQ